MTSEEPSVRTPLQVMRDVVVGSLPGELTPAALKQLRQDLLSARSGRTLKGVIIDASAVEVMDADDYRSLCETAHMCRVMGRPAVVCGLMPGVVSSLVDFDVDADRLVTALNVDAALARLSTPDS